MTKATQPPKFNSLILHKNILRNRLKEIEAEIFRNKSMLENYKNSEFTDDYKNSNINKLQSSIENYENEKKVMELRILEVEKGNLDTDIQADFEKNKQERSLKDKLKIKKIKEEVDRKVDDQEKYNSIVSNDYEERKTLRQTKYEVKKAHFHYCKATETLPEKLEKNLENMPMNKGYKFRGVIFFGKLPPTEENYVIFERIDKDTMYIHLWEKDFIYLYEKKGKSKKILLEKMSRKTKINKCTLGQYFHIKKINEVK